MEDQSSEKPAHQRSNRFFTYQSSQATSGRGLSLRWIPSLRRMAIDLPIRIVVSLGDAQIRVLFEAGSTQHAHATSSHVEADLASKKPEASPDELPPNISLNSHDQKKQYELIFFAIFAILIQAAPLIYSGFLLTPGWSRKPILASSYLKPGLITYMVSTAALAFSMFMCAMIIDKCSREVIWERETRSRPRDAGQNCPAAVFTA